MEPCEDWLAPGISEVLSGPCLPHLPAKFRFPLGRGIPAVVSFLNRACLSEAVFGCCVCSVVWWVFVE